jgi:hypothetical protein
VKNLVGAGYSVVPQYWQVQRCLDEEQPLVKVKGNHNSRTNPDRAGKHRIWKVLVPLALGPNRRG